MNDKKPEWLTADFLHRLLGDAKQNSSRARYLSAVASCNRWYEGDSSIAPLPGFDDMELDDRHAVARLNKIKETVDKVNSIFMKNYPVVRRWPYYGEDAELADHMDAMFLDAWEDTHGQFVVRSMLQEAEITGLSVCKIHWNPYDVSRHKTGQIVIEKLEPGSVYFDPHASNMHRAQDCRYIIHETEQPLHEILARFPDEGPVALGFRDSRGRKGRRRGVMRMLAMSAQELVRNLMGKSYDKDAEIIEKYPVYEFWVFPQTMYDTELVGGEDVEVGEYPYGLVATLINDHIVRVMPNPFVKRMRAEMTDEFGPRTRSVEVGHKRHPFIPLFWTRKGDSEGKGKYKIYDCVGLVENAISLQFNVNALRRNTAIHARTVANPVMLINEDALKVPQETLTWTPGQIINIRRQFSAEQAVKILQGAQMPQFVYNMIQDDIAAIDQTAGIQPGVVGLFPRPAGGTSHTPAMTVGLLQESAFGPLWVYIAELAVALLDMSVLYDGLIQQKYKPDRYMATGRTGQQVAVTWTKRHITANFKRQVVAGATSTLYDLDKANRVANFVGITNNAIASQNPVMIEVAVAHLQALDDPHAYQFIQILERELERLEQLQQGLQMLGAGEMLGQQALPEGGAAEDFSGIEMLGEELGIPAEEIMISLEE